MPYVLGWDGCYRWRAVVRLTARPSVIIKSAGCGGAVGAAALLGKGLLGPAAIGPSTTSTPEAHPIVPRVMAPSDDDAYAGLPGSGFYVPTGVALPLEAFGPSGAILPASYGSPGVSVPVYMAQPVDVTSPGWLAVLPAALVLGIIRTRRRGS